MLDYYMTLAKKLFSFFLFFFFFFNEEVSMIFLFLGNVWVHVEASCQDNSNEHPQHINCNRNNNEKKKYPKFITKYSLKA